MKQLKVIGRSEIVDFPSIGLSAVRAKTDTGAFTSSIHCKSIRKIDDMQVVVVFLDEEHDAYAGKEHVFDIIDEVDVKSSNGETEKRVLIKSDISINGDTHDILLTLTDRAVMKFPVLIGRRFIRGKYLVDVRLSNK